MQSDCMNIYQTARKVAGLTQERAAELLGLSPRTLADYEAGLRLPPNDVADRMVTSEDERERYDHAADALRSITAAAIALVSVPRGGA